MPWRYSFIPEVLRLSNATLVLTVARLAVSCPGFLVLSIDAKRWPLLPPTRTRLGCQVPCDPSSTFVGFAAVSSYWSKSISLSLSLSYLLFTSCKVPHECVASSPTDDLTLTALPSFFRPPSLAIAAEGPDSSGHHRGHDRQPSRRRAAPAQPGGRSDRPLSVPDHPPSSSPQAWPWSEADCRKADWSREAYWKQFVSRIPRFRAHSTY
jgi:hypothetical protein